MVFRNEVISKRVFVFAALVAAFYGAGALTPLAVHAQTGQPPATQSSGTARPVGTIKSISGNTIILTSDAGADVTVQVQDATKFLRIAPGQKDLKDATAIQLTDVQPGDRILVRGKLADDGKAVLAASVIAMKKTDIADKQAHERDEWQKHGLGGIVSGVDAATGSINVSLPALGEKKTVVVHLSQATVLRRYAVDSVKFDDAKPAPLDQINPGDQLRARGTRSADGAELTADEIVSGTFRNIAGMISALDASAGTITVQDLVAKRNITVKITSESQVRKLPPAVAQRIAARLKGTPAEGQSLAGGSNGTSAAANTAPAGNSTARPAGGPGAGANGGMGRPGSGSGGGDLQQMISRLPAATLAELQKGDAVMIVSTEGSANSVPTVITLLGGVEPILEASPKSSASTILSPWSLSSGGEVAAP